MRTTLPVGTRGHSIWLSQLLLAIVVVVIVLLVQSLSPVVLEVWTFTVGVSTIVVLTAVALVVPWHRLPPWAVLGIPLLDIVAIGFINHDTPVDFAFLWVFPVTWIATNFPIWAIGIALGTVATFVILEEAQRPAYSQGTLRFIIITLSLTFIAISTYAASRQTRAFKRLLRREASRLNETLIRSTRQEQQLSRVLGSIDVGVVRVSPEGDVLEANQTYRALYDIADDDPALLPRAVEYDDYRGTALAGPDRPLSRACAGEDFHDVRTWLFTPQGTWRALSLTARALPDAAGLASGERLLVAQDITEAISAERARIRLAAHVSHELRNPLTTIMGYSELVLDGARLDPTERARIEAISEAADRLMVLAGAVLEAGRHAQMGAAPPSPTDLSRVVSDSVESLSPTAEAAGVALEFAPSAGVGLLGDAFQLRQVSDNLLSNAIKYTPKGGQVSVDVHSAEDHAVLRVTDTGMGMDAADIAHIYDPYYRAPAAVESEIVGSGLGMGIVQSIVAEHRGSIVIDSQRGKGTRVTVRLPIEGPAEPAAITEGSPDA